MANSHRTELSVEHNLTQIQIYACFFWGVFFCEYHNFQKKTKKKTENVLYDLISLPWSFVGEKKKRWLRREWKSEKMRQKCTINISLLVCELVLCTVTFVGAPTDIHPFSFPSRRIGSLPRGWCWTTRNKKCWPCLFYCLSSKTQCTTVYIPTQRPLSLPCSIASFFFWWNITANYLKHADRNTIKTFLFFLTRCTHTHARKCKQQQIERYFARRIFTQRGSFERTLRWRMQMFARL